jgi:hypothetical protein
MRFPSQIFPANGFLLRRAETEQVRHFPQMEARFDRSRTNRLDTAGQAPVS